MKTNTVTTHNMAKAIANASNAPVKASPAPKPRRQAARRSEPEVMEVKVPAPSAPAFHTVYAEAPTKAGNPKDAISGSKLPLGLWPATATAMGALGLLDGATRYGQANYRVMGARASVYINALRRHLEAYAEGEEASPDSGVPHLASMLANIAILVDCSAAGNLVDDRTFPGGYHTLVDQLTEISNRIQAERAHLHPHHYTKADADN